MINRKYEITDAELEIMNILWEKSPLTLNEIVNQLSQKEERNKSTIKTLLYRLVEKGSVKSKTEKNKKENRFEPEISQKQYRKKENENFLQKLYHGSTNKLLLNFVEEKKITKKDLQDLLNLIDE
ncbi:MAG: BlaI/MecI/CopY family transcriptional regulator [Clostridia bacterium]|nr:BlaI/MecI/CopY family transcriptional regulator [Clostridia bacterium]